MKRSIMILGSLLFTLLLISCGPSVCDCYYHPEKLSYDEQNIKCRDLISSMNRMDLEKELKDCDAYSSGKEKTAEN